MIAYQLKCRNGHGFEGWFRDSAAYEAQAADGKLRCPDCNSRKIEKAVMAPAVATSRGREARRAALREHRRAFLAEAQHVGERFPDEARRIHYGEAKQRLIYGEASGEEVSEMLDEGIEIAPMPPDPDAAH